MKKVLYSLLVVTVLIVATIALGGCSQNAYSITYKATDGGYIKGRETQVIQAGQETLEVIATPLEGFRFVKWLDNDSDVAERKDINVQSDITAIALFEKSVLTVNYQSDDLLDKLKGHILGDKLQSIPYGNDAQEVMAQPSTGYVFLAWSDGLKSATRVDRNVITDINVYPIYIKRVQTLTYNYNGATGNNGKQSVTLAWDKLNQAEFILPTKDNFTFQGWYLDEKLENKLVNGVGDLLMGNEALIENNGQLYAKWTPNDAIVYNILLTFVTRTKAELQIVDNDYSLEVDYTMTDKEKQVYRLIPKQLSKALNELCDGKILFEVDSYFTTELVGSDSYTKAMPSYFMMASSIPEVAAMHGHNTYYRSILTTLRMNDFDHMLHCSSGLAQQKYGNIFLDGILQALDYSLDVLLDLTNPNWESLLHLYAHELAHTVEMQLDIDRLHNWEGSQILMDPLEAIKCFFLNEAILDGESVGIPLSFWKGELEIRADYIDRILWYDGKPHNGGRVMLVDEPIDHNAGVISQYVSFNGNAKEVIAIAEDGFRFVKWSDGITSAVRQDKSIKSYLTVEAIFEKI